MKAMSPPTFTWKKSSEIRVPKTALRGKEGIQYLRSPFSRYGLMMATRVPRFLASAMYLSATGWLLARFVPQRTRRSVPMKSESEHVGAA